MKGRQFFMYKSACGIQASRLYHTLIVFGGVALFPGGIQALFKREP